MNYIVFSISGNKNLAKEIANSLNAELGKIYKKTFADGEIMVKSSSDVKDKDVIIVQSTSKNVNEELFSLLLLLDSVKRAGARSIKLFMPYFAYSRQERVSWINEPVSCEVVAKLVDTADFDDLTCFDLHHPLIEGFFKHRVTNKPTTRLFAQYYTHYFNVHHIDPKNVVIVSPDHGSNTRADMLSRELGGIDIVILDKVRPQANRAEHLEIDAEQVKGKICILIDDIIDTGGTIASASELLHKNGAQKVLVSATHAVLSKGCLTKLRRSKVADLVVTNTIEKNFSNYIKVVDILPLVLEEIKRK
ncbi:MAG: ribose-phosphate pyrophosphokinase [Bacilli bacterium]|nr:ribose-phosphate pyrophosphokinase [Bacilli bacterium]